jgi:hypothetical protein
MIAAPIFRIVPMQLAEARDLVQSIGSEHTSAAVSNTAQIPGGQKRKMDIVQLVYRPAEPQGASKDYDFSRSSMQRLWQQGASAVETVLRASPWLAPKSKELGVRVFDVP